MEALKKATAYVLVVALVAVPLVGIVPTATAQDPRDVEDHDGDGVLNGAESQCNRAGVRQALDTANTVPELAPIAGACTPADETAFWCTPAACWQYDAEEFGAEHDQTVTIPLPPTATAGEDADGDNVPSTLTFAQSEVRLGFRTADDEHVFLAGPEESTGTFDVPLDPADDDPADPLVVGCSFTSDPFLLPDPLATTTDGVDADGDGVDAHLVLAVTPVRAHYDLCDGATTVEPIHGAATTTAVPLDPNDADENVPRPQVLPDENMDEDDYSNSEEIFAPAYLDAIPLLADAAADVELLNADQDAYFRGVADAAAVSLVILGQATYFADDRSIADPDADLFKTGEEEFYGTDPQDGRSHPNRAPEIADLPATLLGKEGVAFALQVVVSDADAADDVEDGVMLTLRAADGSALPDWLTVEPASATTEGDDVTFDLAGTPGYEDEGNYTFALVASDDGHDDRRNVTFGSRTSAPEPLTIRVAHGNAPPVLDTVGPRDVAENGTLEFNVTSSDIDGQPGNYSATGLPAGADLSSAGLFRWTPTFDQAGSYDVTIAVADDDAAEPKSDAETVRITVANTNRAPTLAAIDDVNVLEGATVEIVLDGSDPDGTPLAYTVEDAPGGAIVDGVFTWATDPTDAGVYDLTFTASDGELEASQATTVTVANVNRAPVFAPLGPQTGAEGASVTFTVAASDPDAGETVTLSADALPEGAAFDPDTGVFAWTPAYNASGNYTTAFRATDDNVEDPLNSTITVPITVNQTWRAPELDVDATQVASENATLTFDVTATDADTATDGDTVVLAAEALPAGATFDADTGVFEWTPDFDDGPASYVVNFTATDSTGLTDRESVSVQVDNTNRVPTIGAIEPQTVAEGAELTFVVPATDADGSSLDVTVDGLPTPATVTEVNGTYVFAWTPGYTHAGSYDASLVADDGEALSLARVVTLTVTNTDRAPVLDAIANQTVAEGATLAIAASAADPDGDAVTYALVTPPTGAAIDAETGAFAWTPTGTQAGAYTLTVEATAGGLTATRSFGVSVVDDTTPVLASIGPKATDENATLAFTVTATDADGSAPVLSTTGLPAGATFDAESGAFSWTPTYAQSGTYNVTFAATDGASTDEEIVGLDVAHVNVPPTLDVPATLAVDETDLATLDLGATDFDGDALTCTRTGMGSVTGCVWSWQTTYEHEGTYTISFLVSDGQGGSASASVELTVGKTNRAPTVGFALAPTREHFLAGYAGHDTAAVRLVGGDADAEDDASVVFAVQWGDGSQVVARDTTVTRAYANASGAAGYQLEATAADAAATTSALGPKIYVWAPAADQDGDGLTNAEEVTGSRNLFYGQQPTHPARADTDGDGQNDRAEIEAGSDPNVKRATVCDWDGDGIPNSGETSADRRNRNSPVPGGLVVVGACDNKARSLLQVGTDDVGAPFAYVDENENGRFDAGDRRLAGSADVLQVVADVQALVTPTVDGLVANATATLDFANTTAQATREAAEENATAAVALVGRTQDGALENATALIAFANATANQKVAEAQENVTAALAFAEATANETQRSALENATNTVAAVTALANDALARAQENVTEARELANATVADAQAQVAAAKRSAIENATALVAFANATAAETIADAEAAVEEAKATANATAAEVQRSALENATALLAFADETIDGALAAALENLTAAQEEANATAQAVLAFADEAPDRVQENATALAAFANATQRSALENATALVAFANATVNAKVAEAQENLTALRAFVEATANETQRSAVENATELLATVLPTVTEALERADENVTEAKELANATAASVVATAGEAQRSATENATALVAFANATAMQKLAEAEENASALKATVDGVAAGALENATAAIAFANATVAAALSGAQENLTEAQETANATVAGLLAFASDAPARAQENVTALRAFANATAASAVENATAAVGGVEDAALAAAAGLEENATALATFANETRRSALENATGLVASANETLNGKVAEAQENVTALRAFVEATANETQRSAIENATDLLAAVLPTVTEALERADENVTEAKALANATAASVVATAGEAQRSAIENATALVAFANATAMQKLAEAEENASALKATVDGVAAGALENATAAIAFANATVAAALSGAQENLTEAQETANATVAGLLAFASDAPARAQENVTALRAFANATAASAVENATAAVGGVEDAALAAVAGLEENATAAAALVTTAVAGAAEDADAALDDADGDADLVPDDAEPTVCLIQEPGNTLDGECDGDDDYVLPGGLARPSLAGLLP